MNPPAGAPIIEDYLRERIAAGDFPSAVYLVAEKNEIRWQGALGLAARAPVPIPAALDTIYDLASLTKPLVTGLLCARLIERGELTLRDKIASYLPEFARREDFREITLQHLLTHTAGLAAWRSLRALTDGDRERTLAAIAAEPLAAAPGAGVIYSDLGFITLGFLLEKIAGEPFAALAAREIFAPLALSTACFNPDFARRERIAASETGNLYEREMYAQNNAPPVGAATEWREHLIWGEVHDGNAYYLGGAAGHAGLFGTAFDVRRLAAQFVASTTELLRPATCAMFTRNMTPDLNEARSPGWQLAATPNSTAGPGFPPDGFGHTGFTGTSCWVDSARERIFILLTNRTHDHAPPFVNINGVRRRFHSLALSLLG